jgi:enamine deaminase RidA (YjgF/YER057c/UK114 family)
MAMEFINPAGLSTPTGYAHVAIVTGRQVHVSGQVALSADGQVVGKDDLAAQTKQVYANLAIALAAAGASFADVFKLVTYVVGLTTERAGVVRKVRSTHFDNASFPASTMVGVTELVHPDLLIEIEAIATID